VESFGSRIRDELLAVEQFSCLTEAQVLVADWREDYNERRPHSALQMMAPAKFARAWRRATEEGRVIPLTDPGEALRSSAKACFSPPVSEKRAEPAPGADRDAPAAAPLAFTQTTPTSSHSRWTDERRPVNPAHLLGCGASSRAKKAEAAFRISLVPSSHCRSAHARGVEQGLMGRDHPDS
jgi:hypothetical protein